MMAGNFQGTNDSFDDLDTIDYISSPSDISFPATSNSSPGPLNDVPQLSDDDPRRTLDSFIPILIQLSGLCLDETNLYYIRGPITTDDWKALRGYTENISKFILTDVNTGPLLPRISPATFLRLARLQHPDMPLLPSLSDLVIVDADASIAYLELLLTPSLKSLKASHIPNDQQSAFFFFLIAIKQEAPLLQTLILGPGRFPSSFLQTIYQFHNLRHLELKHDDSMLPYSFFDGIGSLPKLETLILDVRYVSSIMTKYQWRPPKMDEPNLDPSPHDSFPDSNLTDGKSKENSSGDELLSPTCRTPISTSGTYNHLKKLHVIGWLPFLEELFPRIMSTRLEDVSVTFIRLSYDELQVSLAKEKEEQEEMRRREAAAQKKAEAEKRAKEDEQKWWEEARRKRAEELRATEAVLRAEEAEIQQLEAEAEENWQRAEDEMQPKKEAAGTFWGETCEEEIPSSSNDKKKKKGGKNKSSTGWCVIEEAYSTRYDPPIAPPAERPSREAEKKLLEEKKELLEEKERLRLASRAFFDAHTVSITELLQTLYSQWTVSLKAVSISQLNGSFQQLSEPLPVDIFRGLLLLPAIESLDVTGWMLDSVEGVMKGAKSMPNLKSLMLPLDESNAGISLPTLRLIAESCPKLESFQTRIEPLSLIPEYSVPTTEALSHGLQVLSVGNSFPHPDPTKLYLIARHLYLLFPNLKTIKTSPGYNAEQWFDVDRWVKGFQTARIDDMNRPTAPVTQ